MKQEKEEIEAAIQGELDQARKKLAADNEISLKDFDDVLQPIIGSCTKDSIAVSINVCKFFYKLNKLVILQSNTISLELNCYNS